VNAALGLAVLVGLVWTWLILLHGRFWQGGPVLPPRDGRATTTPVTVVVPARDEAGSIGQSLRSLLAQDYAGPLAVILVDDGSTDGTGAIARAIDDPRLRVIDGAPRPAGWSGKLWAVRQGLAHATTPLVLLTDADIVHGPGHLASLVAKAEADGLDLVSEMVTLRCESVAERLLVPAFVFFFQLLYPFAWVNDPKRATAAAAGGTMLVRTTALARIGGIDAVRGALIDDVALAASVKRGGPIWLGHAGSGRSGAVSVRPYATAGDIWRMIARTAFVQLRYSALLLTVCVAGMLLTWIAPLGLALFAIGWARWIGAAVHIAAAASFVPTLRRFGRSPLYGLLLPGIAGFYLAATIGSALDHWRGRGVAWKGRAYREAQT
jgi:hopene-associated glycosyltransferase HpnB